MNIPATNGITYIPQDFAQEGDSDSDTLERFFAFAGTGKANHCRLAATGKWNIDRTLVITKAGKRIDFDLWLTDTVGLDDMVHIIANANADWSGKMVLRGVRGETASLNVGRDTVNGVRLSGNRLAKLCDIDFKGGSGWAAYHTSGGGPNSNMMELGNIVALNAGANARRDREYLVKIASFQNRESNNIHQRTVMHVADPARIPSEAHRLTKGLAYTTDETGFKKAHKITDVDYEKGTITVYPRIPDKYQYQGIEIGLVFGGGLCLNESGNTARATFGTVTATRSGPAVWLSEQYTPHGKGITSQYCATAAVFGDEPQNAYNGTVLGHLYCEGEPIANFINTCQTKSSSSTNGSVINATTGLRPENLQTMGWLRPNGQEGKQGKFYPFTFPYNGTWFYPPHQRDVVSSTNDDESSYGVYASPLPDQQTYATVIRKTSRLYLNDNKDLRELRGIAPIRFELYGDGKNGEYRKNFEVACATGYTINGKASPLVLPRYKNPVTIHALLGANNNWHVSITEHQVPE
ncbi:hypothetical protein [Vreelandella populi]|uniref:hypothetical protein n=1 Tax=Vreelandella populi TaxID=2498858 RepID=UPI000F8F13A1|nr:hypothetical protein [Halomonas populi]RUR52693.1 hypothetical protein ELY40_11625 [Halomonas populi]